MKGLIRRLLGREAKSAPIPPLPKIAAIPFRPAPWTLGFKSLLHLPDVTCFHVIGYEQWLDWACESDSPARGPFPPDYHLCRRHFAAFEHARGIERLAHCVEPYLAEGSIGCQHSCAHCADEKREMARAIDRLRDEGYTVTPPP